MRRPSTPMGVFSVIQKHKFHHSNIYSGAPMPYMQRITWSGVAMHAGVLPGYPASHGCIRMPMAFAVKMWNWTRMGARVVVTPGEMTPGEFLASAARHPEDCAAPVAPKSRRSTRRSAPRATRAPMPDRRRRPPVRHSLDLRSTVGRRRRRRRARGRIPRDRDPARIIPPGRCRDASPAAAPTGDSTPPTRPTCLSLKPKQASRHGSSRGKATTGNQIADATTATPNG